MCCTKLLQYLMVKQWYIAGTEVSNQFKLLIVHIMVTKDFRVNSLCRV